MTTIHSTPVDQRAGTRIDRRRADRIYSTVSGARQLQGLIDRAKRVFQTGGRWNMLFTRRLGAISIPADVWERVRDDVNVLEVIDHGTNRCYRVSIEDARQYGAIYEAGGFRRFALPLRYWTVSS